jgi:nucleoside-diphosphate-sugar epimerase
MSPFRFIKWVKQDIPLEIFGDGSQRRDFTYVEDIARGTVDALRLSGYEIVNLGNNHPAPLSGMIALIEKHTGKKARYTYREFHKADMQATWADISKAKRLLGWEPEIGLDEGIRRTVAWTEENWKWIKDMPV